MKLLFVSDFRGDPKEWARQLTQRVSGVSVLSWDDVVDSAEVDAVLTDTNLVRRGGFSQFSRLRWVQYLGHGVGDVLLDPSLPAGIVITRLRRASMAQSIAIYVINAITGFHLRRREYRANQCNQEWRFIETPPASSVRVCVLGQGIIGQTIATNLSRLGYRVSGWSRTEKHLADVTNVAGAAALPALLAESDMIVGALPETRHTIGLLNKRSFARMKNGVYIVNIGRGSLIVEDDLLGALAQGKVCGAALDVFALEPLPREHAFWRHPKVDVSPHVGGVGKDDKQQVYDEIAENCRRFMAGETLTNVVDCEQGY
jgi:glyoxylate/hydroxypyruvate reductase A